MTIKNTLSNKRTKWLILVIVLVVLIGGGTGAYLYLKPAKTVKAPKTSGPVAAVVSTSTTKQYISNGNDLNLSFNYPSDWTVSPASGNNPNDQTITLTSPLANIEDSAGSIVTGKAIVTIRPGDSTISELNSNNPVAAQNSTQFAYSSPTSSQYAYPYLTYIHFSNGATTPAAFEEVIVTGNTQFNANESVTGDSLTGLDPIISAAFYRCATDACMATSATRLSIDNNTYENGTTPEQVQALFASMKLN